MPLRPRAEIDLRTQGYSDPYSLRGDVDQKHSSGMKELGRPALVANCRSPALSPVDSRRSMSALRSPAFSKHSRAKSNRQTARARSPTAFHLVSASVSGTARTISSAESRSSSCNAKSNLWSESVVTWKASSLRSVDGVRQSCRHYNITTYLCFLRTWRPCCADLSAQWARFARR